MEVSLYVWAGFLAFVLAMLALDLGVFNRKSHAITMKEAGIWTAVWIGLALAFNAVINFWRGQTAALEFLTGYLIEKALSVDNLFVFALIFAMFAVPAKYQHRVLFWGVLGALLLRALFIGAGAALLDRFHWLIYVMGAFLIFTGIKLAFQKETAIHPERNPLVRIVSKVFPVTKTYHGESFFVRLNGALAVTPLFIVLLLVESTDVVFAIDSIPAVFAVTRDPFLVYTSNVFAILGLRSLYFLLAGALDRFYYLKPALAVILSFVGLKMLVSSVVKVPVGASLGVIAGLLAAAVVASLVRAKRLEVQEGAPKGAPKGAPDGAEA
jgi:tellurite resistance protein TerC